MTTKTFDASGTRRPITMLGVDAGMMALSTYRFPDDSEYDSVCDRLHGDAFATGTLVVSSSGVGDGGYDLVHVVDEAGAVKGIEVVFLTPAIDDLTDERTAPTKPPEAVMDLAFSRDVAADDPEREAARALVDAWFKYSGEVRGALLDELLSGQAPEGEPRVVGTLKCPTGSVSAGDPCYGGASWVGELPRGSYVAVVWMVELESWGRRVSRLGLYRS